MRIAIRNLVCATGALLTLGSWGTEGKPPCVMLRFSSAQTRSTEEWKETAKAFAENPGCCDEVWFSTGESFPGLDWHRRFAEEPGGPEDEGPFVRDGSVPWRLERRLPGVPRKGWKGGDE